MRYRKNNFIIIYIIKLYYILKLMKLNNGNLKVIFKILKF